MGAHDLYARGLTGLETICVDGGQGLLAAPAYHGIPVQRCRAHKMRPRQGAQDRSGRRQAGSPRCRPNRTEARSAANRFATRWEEYPKAVACLRDDLLTCFQDPDQRRQVRTTNAIERREVRRRTRPMGAFQDRTSMDRILIFLHKNKQQGISTR